MEEEKKVEDNQVEKVTMEENIKDSTKRTFMFSMLTLVIGGIYLEFAGEKLGASTVALIIMIALTIGKYTLNKKK